MTSHKHSPNKSKGSTWWEDVLKLPNRSRAARLIGTPRLPRPLEAVVHAGFLKWIWYYRDLPPKLDDLLSRRADMDAPPKVQTIPAKLCFDFARLGQASQEEIRLFAKRWGPLRFEARQEESVARWRRHARLAQALLRFTAELDSGGDGDEEDWRVICQSTPAKVALDREHWSREPQLTIVAAAVNVLFSKAHGHGILTMVDRDLQVRPYTSNLLGILITQIAHVIARSDQKAVCAGCRNMFRPSRPIVRGSRQYCDSCRKKKVPQRDAARDYRARRQSKA